MKLDGRIKGIFIAAGNKERGPKVAWDSNRAMKYTHTSKKLDNWQYMELQNFF